MKIHFIGIGGIGVSALAQYHISQGHQVSGSDLVASEITEALQKAGAKIFIGLHKISNIKNQISKIQSKNQKFPDLIIYSPAIKKDNPELLEAKKLGIKTQTYPQALGELTKKYFTIAVSGAHGKSTTTAMLALVLIKAGLEPTVIVGTRLKEFGGSNFKMGKSKYLVIEADEWSASFLNYWPKIIVLTNIDKEHLDYYKNLQNILRTYRKYINHLPKDGLLVANKDDKNIARLLNSKLQFKIQNYSLKQKEAKKIKEILKVPGVHNISNALAVLHTARILGINDKITFAALSQYKGAWRRFEESELKIKNLKLKIISDYGHHPTEVKATLEAAREKYPNKKIWCLFQPHQYQRTYYLFKEFVDVFKKALSKFPRPRKFGQGLLDKVIITDIYSVAGRESNEIKKKVSSEKLVKKINKKNVIYLKETELEKYLRQNLDKTDILIIMGAGNIYQLADKIKKTAK